MTENGNVESVTATNALGENESREGNQDEVESSITFFPPAYIQRYNAVVNVLEGPRYKSKIKKVYIVIAPFSVFCFNLQVTTLYF